METTNSKTTAYVVTGGEYSDYHIEGVFLDKETAEAWVRDANRLTHYKSAYRDGYVVEEYVVGELGRKGQFYSVRSAPNSIEVASVEFRGMPITDFSVHHTSDGIMWTHVAADSFDHAVKIAADRFREFKAIPRFSWRDLHIMDDMVGPPETEAGGA